MEERLVADADLGSVGGPWGRGGGFGEKMVLRSGLGNWEFRIVRVMQTLGVAVDHCGSTDVALQHRIAQGWVHYHSRSDVLECRQLPLRARWQRCHETVFRTVLFGAGGWTLRERHVRLLQSFEQKVMMKMLCRSDKSNGEDEGFVGRLQQKASLLIQKFVLTSLAGAACKLHFGLMGHIARKRDDDPLRQILQFRCADWLRAKQDLVAATGGGHLYPKFKVRGKPVRLEDQMEVS